MSRVAVEGGSIEFGDTTDEAYPQFSATRDNQTRIRVGIIDADKWDELLEELWPSPRALPGAYPGYDKLKVRSASAVPIIGREDHESVDYDADVIAWEKLKVTIEYGTLGSHEIISDQLQEHRRTFSGHMLQLPSHAMYWQSDSSPVKQEQARGAKMVPTIEHKITIPLDDVVNRSTAIVGSIGKVNSVVFLDADPETLLYLGTSEQAVRDYAGATMKMREHTFQQRLVNWGTFAPGSGTVATWNHLFRPDTGTFDRPEVGAAGGPPIYALESGTFANLWG